MNSQAIRIIIFAGLLSPLVSLGQVNLLQNPSFDFSSSESAERPADWEIFSDEGIFGEVTLVSGMAQDGDKSLKFSFSQPDPSDQWRGFGISQIISARENDTLVFSGYFRPRNNLYLPPKAFASLRIDWIGLKEGNESYVISSSSISSIGIATIDSQEWRRFELKAKAPEGTTEAKVIVSVHPRSAASGGVFVDHLSLNSTTEFETAPE